MKNQNLAQMFDRIADILEIQGELPFKVNAYRKASRVIGDLQDDIEIWWQEKRLRQLPGVGEAIAKKIDEYFTTGRMKKYDEVTSEIPSELIDLLNIQNLGPKTLGLAYKKLGVKNLSDLQRAIEDGSLTQLPGMGEKKIENILKGIELYQSSQSRISIGNALPIVEVLIAELKQRTKLDKISPAGSVRRMKETVGDIDILVATDEGAKAVDSFIHLPQVKRILAAGETKGSVLVENNFQVDLRAVSIDSYGAALQYFTGSQAHNIKLRGIARKRGLKINEYGIFEEDKKLGGATEEEIYRLLGLRWITPELREDRGEVEAAAEGDLPQLIEMKDIKGDLHVHSNYSDGHASIENMVQHAQKLGYQYLAFCDHSKAAQYAQGIKEDKLLQQIEEINSLNRKLTNFKILKGIEVDILANGQLDFPDEILVQLDIVVASIHTGFKQRVTERIIAALENPHVDIIAHPTGRLISKREGYEVDINKVMEKAAETGTALEINAYPIRLDLSDINARKVEEMGIMLAINTDAHSPDDLTFMKFGVGTARRGWVEKEHVLNARSLNKIIHWKKARMGKN